MLVFLIDLSFGYIKKALSIKYYQEEGSCFSHQLFITPKNKSQGAFWLDNAKL